MPKNVIVVGMPRSGTSMTTGIFANAGYYLTQDNQSELRSGDEFNPSGYFESESLIQANAQIFENAGFQFDNTWLYDAITQEQFNNINTLKHSDEHINLVSNYNQNQPWVWKDPRLCYTLGYWWPLMDQSNTGVLLLKRNPEEIYNSFIRLGWRKNTKESRADVFNRIKNHLQAAEKIISQLNIPYVEIHYDEYKKKPALVIQKLNEFFGLELKDSELKYDDKLNTSSFRGKITKIFNKVGDLIPDRLRKLIKKLTPNYILKFVFPGRYK